MRYTFPSFCDQTLHLRPNIRSSSVDNRIVHILKYMLPQFTHITRSRCEAFPKIKESTGSVQGTVTRGILVLDLHYISQGIILTIVPKTLILYETVLQRLTAKFCLTNWRTKHQTSKLKSDTFCIKLETLKIV